MVKAKLKSQVMVPDGTGGMVPIQDQRFERGDWPIAFEIPKENADSWFSHLYAECARCGWSSAGIRQIEAKENSGSLFVKSAGNELGQLAITWERKRNGPLKVRAKSTETTGGTTAGFVTFLDEVNRRCLAGITERIYRRGHLQYDGLAWRGELWLDDTVRLGPPTVQYEDALFGPRIILVDVLNDCPGKSEAPFALNRKLRELSAFLSVVLGTCVSIPECGSTWTFSLGLTDCAVRSVGYFEPVNPESMPLRNEVATVAFQPVTRPDFSRGGIDGSMTQMAVPTDIIELWNHYSALGDDRRRDFLQAAAKFREAQAHWGKERTLSFALMVVACESLKPPEFKEHNMYSVIEELLGKATADRLQENWFRPQGVRNAHLHRGEFLATELIHNVMASSYQDPTFDIAHRELWKVTQAAIIEWLRRDGIFTLPPKLPRTSTTRWNRDHVFFGLIGIAIGIVLGWLLSLSV